MTPSCSGSKDKTRMKKQLRGLSPRANYNDWGTAICRRSYCQLLRIKGCYVVRVTDPYGSILGFLDRSRYVFLEIAPQLYSRGWVDPVSDPLFLRKSGSAGNRTWPLDLKPGTLTTRPQRWLATHEASVKAGGKQNTMVSRLAHADFQRTILYYIDLKSFTLLIQLNVDRSIPAG
jgi:hypothetical protein